MNINNNWTFYRLNKPEEKIKVDLPYDAMLREPRDGRNPGGDRIAFFKGDDYVYEKGISLKITGKETIYLEFEGVYHDPKIYINDVLAYERHYGYISFIFDATPYLKNGNNVIKVIAINSDQPNSRWYSGSGIYRNVNMYILPKAHLLPRSFKIKTLDYQKGSLSIKAEFNDNVNATIEIKDKTGRSVSKTTYAGVRNIVDTIYIDNPHLWSVEDPYLYRATLSIPGQEETIRIGIRGIELDKEKGFLVNGNRTILYGACIHSDNAQFGAESYKEVEYRKVRQLKELGYNAVRSAHNPIVKDFLDACDELGMYVMDEYVDCWYMKKTKYDYSQYVKDEYEKDIFDIVEKDFNHPSVIFYSTGNEVSETAWKEGAEFAGILTETFHKYDPSRFVTCGINVSFNGMAKSRFAIYDPERIEKEANDPQISTGSSDKYNNMANIVGAEFMKFVSTLSVVDKNTRDAFANMDIAGYNYGIRRYQKDLKKYPNRFICGTETFIFDIAHFYEMSKKNPRVIGDFVWTGLDYLGEAGFASMINRVDHPFETDKSGWLTDEGARKDINGVTTSEGNYTEVVHRIKTIDIGVVSPYDIICQYRRAAWRFNNAIKSYSFEGFENKKCIFYVYCNAPYMRFYQNGKCIKQAKIDPKKCYVKFAGKYVPGEIKADAIASDNKTIISTAILKTAGKDTQIGYYKEKLPEENRFAFVHLDIVDSNGIIKPHKETEIVIENVKGAKLLRFGSPASYNKIGYLTNRIKTYHGMSMAIFEYIDKEFSFDIISEIEKKKISIHK